MLKTNITKVLTYRSHLGQGSKVKKTSRVLGWQGYSESKGNQLSFYMRELMLNEPITKSIKTEVNLISAFVTNTLR